MGSYLSSTDDQQKAMLDEIGYKDYDDLFGCVPDSVKLKRRLSVPEGRSELELCSAGRERTAITYRLL